MGKTVDHVAIAVWDIDASLSYYVNQLGFEMIHDERLPHVRLTYLDAGNVMLQLVQPLEDGGIKNFLEKNGEGLHHICLGVSDISTFGLEKTKVEMGGRGRLCSFLVHPPNGLNIELTEFEPREN